MFRMSKQYFENEVTKKQVDHALIWWKFQHSRLDSSKKARPFYKYGKIFWIIWQPIACLEFLQMCRKGEIIFELFRML